ncbi:HEAT repeat domain-containing protein [Synechococcus sp. CS-205]|uniref:HEAT repeat domain-containing protein n=1 Tax=Synechococcus sp. CS-205 TaxID=2847984 RepID=UPI00223BA411|nr:HEAT repeat domain-containing protein [Synechococcus sp. CS-205]MCT0248825.1 HEAT repeat domain-containing protein [Synechococcus sp. CS-205]
MPSHPPTAAENTPASPTASEPTEQIEALRQADSPVGLLMATRRLAEVCHPAAAPSLVEVLGFNNPGAAVAAVDGLIALGEQAVEPLLANLDGHNYGARAWAVRALAGIGDVRGLELLESALACDIGPSVRRAAARGLGQLRLEGLPQDERINVRQRCLDALLAGGGDGEWVVRYAVAVGLEQLLLGMAPVEHGRPAGLKALQGLAGEPGDETAVVRLRASLALRRLDGGAVG